MKIFNIQRINTFVEDKDSGAAFNRACAADGQSFDAAIAKYPIRVDQTITRSHNLTFDPARAVWICTIITDLQVVTVEYEEST